MIVSADLRCAVNRNRIGDGGKRSNLIGREGMCDAIGSCDGNTCDRRRARSIASEGLDRGCDRVAYITFVMRSDRGKLRSADRIGDICDWLIGAYKIIL